MAEFALIETLRARTALARADVRLGIGDDAALLAPPGGKLLAVTTDTLVAGTHFPLATRAFDVGWKSLAVNLSDLAAMGAEPAWASLALTLPEADPAWLQSFADGFAALARQHRVALVGGDTTQGPLSITLTLHGFVTAAAALRRAGARIGDAVCVTGALGDAAAALRLHLAGANADAALRERLDRPVPRVAQGLALRGRAHACIDLSDGLLADLGHLCAASGVGAEIDADALPASPALRAAFGPNERRALQLAGGDDYELCFTLPEERLAAVADDLARGGCAATRIGRIVAGDGVRARNAQGALIDLPRGGWEHFRA